jgi:hypothetical protein
MTTSKSKTVVANEDQSLLIQQLQEENTNLRQQVTYLRSTNEEDAFLIKTLRQNPNATFQQGMQMIMQRRNDQQKAVRAEQMYQFEQRQALDQQEKFEEMKKRVLEKYPHIEKQFESQKKALEADFEKTCESIKSFFDMDSEAFSEYQSFKYDIGESPIQYSVDYEPGAALQAFRCLVDSTPFFTVDQVSMHFWKNRQSHEDHVISELRELIDKEINNARANMNNEIEDHSKVIVAEDQKNAHQAQKAKARQEREKKKELPFI